MSRLASVLVAAIALLHLGFTWLEMFAWTSRGPRVFKSLPPELFEPTQVMAANQGLYNAFLAAGLLWALSLRDAHWKTRIATLFLIFVAVAGLFGAVTVSMTVFYVQAVPALVALFVLHLL